MPALDPAPFADRLLPGERLLWTGRPAQGIVFTGQDLYLIPFSLLWGGFAIFWEAGVLSMGRAPGFFALWGIPFVLVGLYLIVGRFFVDAWIRRGMRYALTDQRILIARTAPSPGFTALSLARLPDARLSQSASGRGTIRFGQAATPWGNRSFGIWSPALDPTPQFIGIEDAKGVFDQVQRAAAGRNLDRPGG